MKIERLQLKLHNGRPRCQARLSYGSAWVAGRQQCGNASVGDDVLCGTHRRQYDKRDARRRGEDI